MGNIPVGVKPGAYAQPQDGTRCGCHRFPARWSAATRQCSSFSVNVLNNRPSSFCWSTPWGVEAQTLVRIVGGEWVPPFARGVSRAGRN
jgi:hypothetical protein